MSAAIRWLAPVLALALFWMGHVSPSNPAQWIVAGLALWMLLWWVSEAAPLAVTALLPLIVLPAMGVLSIDDVASAYASPVVFLFLGGFLLAASVASCGLHERVAAAMLRWARDDRARQVAAVVFSAGFLSMWISNTATVALMLPMVLAVVAAMGVSPQKRRDTGAASPGAGVECADAGRGQDDARFTALMLLGVAAAANVGGMATLIGTPPNAVLAGYLSREWGYDVGFLRWMAYALPVSLALLVVTWLWILWRLSLIAPDRTGAERPGDRSKGRASGSPPAAPSLPSSDATAGSVGGPQAGLAVASPRAWTPAERRVALVFLGTVLAWMLRPQLNAWGLTGLGDAQIALAAAVLLFVLPAGDGSPRRLLVWEDAQKLPWGVLLLIGGGIALGSAIEQVELASIVMAADLAALERSPLLWIGAMCLFAMVLSHFVSNTAAAALLLPVIAVAAGPTVDAPGYLMFALPVVLAASCAFLLPTATPPNAIVFSTGQVTVPGMVRFGWLLSVVALLLIGMLTLVLYVSRLTDL